MREWKRFKLYSYITGELIMEGTVSEIAKFTGVSDAWIRDAADRDVPIAKKRYRVVDVAKEDRKQQKYINSMREAADNWEKFAAPIREKYGIPVYKAKPEVRG